jgi:hypothetical protein
VSPLAFLVVSIFPDNLSLGFLSLLSLAEAALSLFVERISAHSLVAASLSLLGVLSDPSVAVAVPDMSSAFAVAIFLASVLNSALLGILVSSAVSPLGSLVVSVFPDNLSLGFLSGASSLDMDNLLDSLVDGNSDSGLLLGGLSEGISHLVEEELLLEVVGASLLANDVDHVHQSGVGLPLSVSEDLSLLSVHVLGLGCLDTDRGRGSGAGYTGSTGGSSTGSTGGRSTGSGCGGCSWYTGSIVCSGCGGCSSSEGDKTECENSFCEHVFLLEIIIY